MYFQRINELFLFGGLIVSTLAHANPVDCPIEQSAQACHEEITIFRTLKSLDPVFQGKTVHLGIGNGGSMAGYYPLDKNGNKVGPYIPDTYYIYLSAREMREFSGTLGYKSKVAGVLAHELGHIKDYINDTVDNNAVNSEINADYYAVNLLRRSQYGACGLRDAIAYWYNVYGDNPNDLEHPPLSKRVNYLTQACES